MRNRPAKSVPGTRGGFIGAIAVAQGWTADNLRRKTPGTYESVDVRRHEATATRYRAAAFAFSSSNQSVTMTIV